jgi:hypothetical protein
MHPQCKVFFVKKRFYWPRGWFEMNKKDKTANIPNWEL